jgi:hypothetical protein
MNVSLEILHWPGDQTPHLKNITDKLNQRFQQMKARNPHGYMDAWESRFALTLTEVAQELGARSFDEPNDIYVVDFIGQYEATKRYHKRLTPA